MHTGPTFNVMVQLLRQKRAPAEVMDWVRAQDAKLGPYRPCPCGSGSTFRFCHGDKGAAARSGAAARGAAVTPET